MIYLDTSAYQQKLHDFKNLLKQQISKLTALFAVRAISFILSLFFLYYFSGIISIILFLCFFILFAIFIKLTINLKSKINETKTYIKINQDEIKALNHETSHFHDGKEFINPAHTFSYDMDIFGKSSLFQFLNRSVTLSGKLNLAKRLQDTQQQKKRIIRIQKAVSELKNKLDFRQKFLMTGIAYASSKYFTKDYLQKNDILKKDFKTWIKTPSELHEKTFWKVISIILPVISFSLLILAILGYLPYSFWFFFGFSQLTLVGFKLKYINSQHAQLGQKTKSLQVYAKLLNQIESEDFESEYSSDLQNSLIINNKTASSQIKKLGKLLRALDFRLNILVGFLLNMTLLWDIQVVLRLEQFKSELNAVLDNYFDTVGEFDALISLANFAYNHPDYCFPEIEDKPFVLKMQQAGHPLIHPKERVDNDFEINGLHKIGIITGANMAGKSTFLRTVGVNMILASAGSVVCAKNMTYSPVKLMTSIRTQDSLSENASYFYSELMRLKTITDALKSGEILFVIIDEMLRGTNSKDKHEGSRALIEKLIQYKTSGLLATHDVQLGDLAKKYPENVFNQRFESEITEGKLYFDYKIKSGVSQNLNAAFLMKKHGII